MIAIINYGMGNLGSIANMFKKIGAAAIITSDPVAIEKADKLVLPGVGAFDAGMRNLQERKLIPLLNQKVLVEKTPLVGLCLGMQLLTKESEEGSLAGLGWIDAKTVKFKFDVVGTSLKIPHMGWNTVKPCQQNPLFTGLDAEARFYHVHSYHVVCSDAGANAIAETEYGYAFVSAIARDNILGVQFHPEKSHKFGMRLLSNFVEFF
ncbi:MAG: imidazole glycerol phosphate synthase subunit HisH [Acidobacteria bacterium]|nr:imidazole glycerol phosphate synthase subunit HisH [Acidobacteriota bacterium]